MDRKAQRVTVSERVDLRLMSRASIERVVRGHRAVVIEPKHLARVGVWILRAAAVAAAGRRHIELAVTSPREPRRAAHTGPATEDVLEFRNRRSIEASTSERQRRLFLVHGFQIREVDESIGRELRVQQYLHQPRPALNAHRGHTGNGLRIEHAIPNDSQPAFLLSNEHAGVRKESEAPRIHQLPRDGNDADAHDFRCVEFERLGWYRQWLKSSRSHRDAAIEGNCLLGRGGRLDGEERMLDGEDRSGPAEEKPGASAQLGKPHDHSHLDSNSLIWLYVQNRHDRRDVTCESISDADGVP